MMAQQIFLFLADFLFFEKVLGEGVVDVHDHLYTL
jgi:hypothetical protein